MNTMKDCATKYCLGTPLKGNRKCQKCRLREWRAAHPIAAALASLRWNAKKHGCTVQLTLEEFTQFCNETKYHLLKGLNADDLTIDRPNEEDRVYRIGNMQVLTRSANVIKYKKRKYHITTIKDDDCPF